MKTINDIFQCADDFKSDNLRLRFFEESDIDFIFDLNSHIDNVQFQGYLPYTDISQAMNEYEFIKNSTESKYVLRLLVEDMDGNPVGSVAIHHIEYWNNKLEIGYSIHRSFHRRGYGTELLHELMRVLFDIYGINRVEASVHPDNLASIRLLEKLNFENEGLRKEFALNRASGQYEDRLGFSLRRNR